MYQPLADKIRPRTLDDVVGQQHLLGKNGLLRRVIESGSIPNLIFYGPSGVGKTTVASIIAKQTDRKLYHLNATTAGIADIKAIIDELDTFLTPNGALVYLDEIQYFNKKQQQSLLEFIETGKITLIASTTENPYFYIYNAILSRCTVFEFKPVEASDMLRAVDRAFELALDGRDIPVEVGVASHIAQAVGGDVRKALGAVELLVSGAGENGITLADAQQAAQRSNMRYDRDGDSHYDILSALQKSIRGSDPDAAVHYLARLLDAGHRERGHRPRLSAVRGDCQGVRRQRLSARSARGTHSARTGGDRHGDRAQVQQCLHGDRRGARRHSRRQKRRHPGAYQGRALRRRGEARTRTDLSVSAQLSESLGRAGLSPGGAFRREIL